MNYSGTDTGIIESGQRPFRARARLIRLLGAELISDEVMAVVELVKNGYDADAHHVHVRLDRVTEADEGIIQIRDDGHGMDLDTVLYSWMEPATHHKRPARGRKQRTPLGRIQLGEKGVGRFAADKLGRELELVTRPAGGSVEVVLHVSWHLYDQEVYLDELSNNWFTREPEVFKGDSHGTLLTMRSLRARWDGEMIGHLHNGLTRLVSPNTGNTDFVIGFASSELPSLDGRVLNPLLDTAPYRLAGNVDDNGILTLEETVEEIDLRSLSQNHFWDGSEGNRSPCCGPFYISLSAWDLEPRTISGFGVDRELRRRIKSSSGVSVYRDSFRVWPYGEPDDDWLELNQRRVNNPTLRISNNQVIGFVEITHGSNPDLRDRTSREGLIDNPAFSDLKALVLAAISIVETERFSKRRELLQARAATRRKEGDEILYHLSRARGALNGTGGHARAALREMERLYRKQREREQSRYDQVSRLAGIGMAAEILTDAFSHANLNAMTIMQVLQREINANGSPQLQHLAEQLAAGMELMGEQLDMMAPLYRPDTQEREPVRVGNAIYDVVTLLSGRLTENRTQVTLGGDSGLTVRINRGHLMQVLMILIENAFRTLQEAGIPNPQIGIQLLSGSDFHGLLVSDNGPGVADNVRHLIFEPYYSTRRAGRGLGLHVARDILAAYNSTLDLSDEETSSGGACFKIRFDGRRVSK